ncbi:MAG: hypothetical protein BJ554DRAFT_7476 [Olpidium bornovanus]|uniref:Uncharacterized protein n=1 Tax=Olpidium bornovanus TaxID=278681 RepID=A0A8H7ZWV5_9FUNG|nr:MAG: hypothetical protein BJ554DRAFT_7476 [Olpidium bornovanus]
MPADVCRIILFGAAIYATLYFIGRPNYVDVSLTSQKTHVRRALSRKDTLGRESSPRRQAMIDNLYQMGNIPWPNYFDNLDGADLAPLTRELAHALDSDRIFLLKPTGCGVGQAYVENGCGRGESYSNFECLFQPLSSCSLEDASAPGVDVIDVPGYSKMTGDSFGDFSLGEVPAVWKKRLAELHPDAQLTDGFLRYWWRAQSAAYIARLNSHTSAAVSVLRHNESQHAAWSHGRKGGKPVPYPLPAGTVSLHVRHGDKGMDLVPFDDYVNAALRFTGQNPLAFQRRLFVSSEDPSVIEDARLLPERELEPSTGPARRWEVYTSDIPRMNAGPFKQLEFYGKQRMSYAWILQLLMALECDAWVGTRGSNWNRLIDELRCVYVDRCVAAYIEVGHDKDWKDYGP